MFCRRSECGYLEDGTEIVDGAFCFSGTDLPDGDETLYVTDDPSAEIAVPLSAKQMLFPNIGKDYDSMVQQGYDSFMKWDGQMKKKVHVRKVNVCVNLILWFLKFFELVILNVGRFFSYGFRFFCMNGLFWKF